MPPRSPQPTSRSFTTSERRSLTFERVTPYATAFVILAAAIISYAALVYVGIGIGAPGFVAYLIPLAIDGFAVVCSLGIIRNQGVAGRAARQRTEWVGLFIAVGLSVIGNVWHAIEVGAPSMPLWIKVAFGTAIPLFVAYNVHVYGRAMASGIGARVLVDQPDRLQVAGLLGAEQPAAAERAPAAVRAHRAAQAAPAAHDAHTATEGERAAERAPATAHGDDEQTASGERRAPITLVRVTERQATSNSAASSEDELADQLQAKVREGLNTDPPSRANAAALHAEMGLPWSPAKTRRIVAKTAADWKTSQDPQGGGEEDGQGEIADLEEARIRVGAR